MPVFHAIMDVEESEGVERIVPVPERRWGLRFLCASCREESTGMMYVDPSDTCEREGGTHNFICKCKSCKAEIAADVLPLPVDAAYYSAEKINSANIVAAFEVRGAQPVELEVDNQWNVITTGGVTFEKVDLSGDWYEYDPNTQQPVDISGVSVRFVKPGKK